MPTTRVTLLYCGQGMMTLIEVYNGGITWTPDYVAVVDCGGSGNEKDSDDPTRGSVQVIARAVEARGRLDCLVISHQDSDHVDKLPWLAKEWPAGATIGNIVLGGLVWDKNRKDDVRTIASKAGYALPATAWPTQAHSDYPKSTPPFGSFATLGHVHLRMLVNGVKYAGGNAKNMSSAVVVVDDGIQRIVLPGDATVDTMHHINYSLPDLDGVLVPVRGLEIPHHGALASAVKEYIARGDVTRMDWEELEGFARLLEADAAGASAGPFSKHNHPMSEVLDVFEGHAEVVEEHRYVAYDFTDYRWRNLKSVRDIHTTVRQTGANLMAYYPVDAGVGFKDSTSAWRRGEFVYGDIIFRMATPPDLLRPEEMVEFRPRGFIAGGVEEPVHQAPAP